MLYETNAKGLLSLSQGRYDEAARTFRSCLSALHSLLIEEKERHVEMHNMALMPRKPAYGVFPTSLLAESTVNDRSCFFLYNKAFFIAPLQQQVDDAIKTIDEHYFSAVFLYNLGLSFHLRAETMANTRSDDLKKALSMYNMALRFFQGMSEHEEEQSTLLMLAIFNNMAHIHLEFYDMVAFETRISWVSEVLEEGEGNEEQENSFFALNLLFSDQSNCFRLAPVAWLWHSDWLKKNNFRCSFRINKDNLYNL